MNQNTRITMGDACSMCILIGFFIELKKESRYHTWLSYWNNLMHQTTSACYLLLFFLVVRIKFLFSAGASTAALSYT